MKASISSFWFDKWTKHGALYHVEGDNVVKEELELRESCREGRWDEVKLRSKLSEKMTNHILENIKPLTELETNDTPWWMGNSQEKFTVKASWEIMSQK